MYQKTRMVIIPPEGNIFPFPYIFHKYQRQLIRTATRVIGSKMEAQDIVTEAFLRYWYIQADFHKESSIKGFLYIAVANACRNTLEQKAYRARVRKEMWYGLEDYTEYKLLEQSQHIRLEESILDTALQLVENLPKKCKICFVKNIFQGMNIRDISQQLKISEHTVRNQIVRGKILLRQRFEARQHELRLSA